MSSKKNPGEEFTGKLGDTVSYYLGNKYVKRLIGKNDGPRSEGQLAFYKLSKEINQLLEPIKGFIHIGYKLEIVGTDLSTMNQAYSYIFKNAIIGSSPNQEIDFTKVLVSKGNMDKTLGQSARAISRGIEFTWTTDENGKMNWDDTVMLMAYFPELKDAQYLLSGARRTVGIDILELTEIPDQTLIHTYISFISADHKNISNSVYTGAILWNNK